MDEATITLAAEISDVVKKMEPRRPSSMSNRERK
jgi:hypothetical protein